MLTATSPVSFDAQGHPMPMMLRGNPPVGTCTICVGKKEIGWQAHFGVVRALENQTFYRGE